MYRILIALCLTNLLISCQSGTERTQAQAPPSTPVMGASRFEVYLPLLEGKKVALAVNHTSLVGGGHLVDTLMSQGVAIEAVFTPEHGFRGTADAGEKIEEQSVGYDFRIESLYGKTRRPTPEMMKDIDVVIFDIQDVGVRFYTYISTMHYLMEACAERGLPMILLDRPNPNGSYIDGPVLDTAFRSFVGMHPIPVVHGLTVGELAQMINGEGWLGEALRCDLTVVPVQNWIHSQSYSLPVKPSPNLPNDLSIALYPSLCFFEGTTYSVGRGTDAPFQQFGHPKATAEYSFIPGPWRGATSPKLEGEVCYGKTYAGTTPQYQFSLQDIIDAYQDLSSKDEPFFNNYFNTLAGSDELREQIISGLNEAQIRETWQEDLTKYIEKRRQYLLYPD